MEILTRNSGADSMDITERKKVVAKNNSYFPLSWPQPQKVPSDKMHSIMVS